mgnify:CR=1 FL=1|jgi:diguanylate cyclase (GGDEF)-like protein
MLAENQLQTRLIAILFLLSALTMLLLGVQNYRYGLYDLVYSASFLSVLFIAVSAYARFTPEAKYLKQACLVASIIALLLILSNSFTYPEEIKHWIFPLGLLSYIALSFRQASLLNATIATIFSLVLLTTTGFLSAITFAATYSLFIGLASTYAQLHQKRSRSLVELEIHDPLTKAYNFRHLEDTLRKEICRADRTGKSLSLITLEIDYFPQLHDMHGVSHTHSLLVRFSETLRAMIRAGDSDYFDGKHNSYLLLPCTPSEGVLVIAERIRRTIEESSWPIVDSITVSLGCASYIPTDGATNREANAQKLIDGVHIALMEAQKNGHNRVCLHSH